MFKKSILFILCCLTTIVVTAQDAKSHIEAFVKKMNAYPIVEMNFIAKFENLQDNATEEHRGTLLYSGNKFRILMGEIEVYCDGKSKWFYNKPVDEVTIFPAGEAMDITDNPLAYITANYKNGFKYKQKPDRTEDGKQLKEIEMFPNDRKSNYISIILTFEAKSLSPYIINYNTKDGIRYTVKVINFASSVTNIEDGSFIYPAQRYPNAEVVDLRGNNLK